MWNIPFCLEDRLQFLPVLVVRWWSTRDVLKIQPLRPGWYILGDAQLTHLGLVGEGAVTLVSTQVPQSGLKIEADIKRPAESCDISPFYSLVYLISLENFCMPFYPNSSTLRRMVCSICGSLGICLRMFVYDFFCNFCSIVWFKSESS